METAAQNMERQNVQTQFVRVSDLNIPSGAYPDMTDYGHPEDNWPSLSKTLRKANILVIGTPTWLGEGSSLCRKVLERLYSDSAELNERGQTIFYGKVAGCVVTRNDDGSKHCSMSLLYAMQHLGFVIPPQADAGWIGKTGVEHSNAGENPGASVNEFTQRRLAFMSWNLMHLANMLLESNGIPGYGNQRDKWENGERFGHPDKEVLTGSKQSDYSRQSVWSYDLKLNDLNDG